MRVPCRAAAIGSSRKVTAVYGRKGSKVCHGRRRLRFRDILTVVWSIILGHGNEAIWTRVRKVAIKVDRSDYQSLT